MRHFQELDGFPVFCKNGVMNKLIALVLSLIFYVPAAHAVSEKRRTPVVEVVQEWGASVVNIGTEQVVYLKQQSFWGNYGSAFDQMFNDYTNRHPVYSPVKLTNIGSGVVIREEGVVVTNAHVVNMASKIFIRFSNGQKVEGKVILENQKDDLAFIKMDPPFRLKAIKLAETEDVIAGETVIAIGSPIGLENSVTTGVVSGKGRSFQLPGTNHVFRELIQTDASINIGSSGGGLLNLDGELVGINLAVVTDAQNIAFAVSSDKIKAGLEVYDQQKNERLISASNRKTEKTVRVPAH